MPNAWTPLHFEFSSASLKLGAGTMWGWRGGVVGTPGDAGCGNYPNSGAGTGSYGLHLVGPTFKSTLPARYPGLTKGGDGRLTGVTKVAPTVLVFGNEYIY